MNIHDRSVGLVTSLVKIYPDLASTRFRIHSVLRKVHSGAESGFKKLRIGMPDSPDHIYVVDGLSNRQRKSCRFKTIRIRVEGA